MVKAALYLFFIGVMPFIVIGVINRVKSIWSGRKGPPILQLFHDTVKLLRKGEVISTAASFVFTLAPLVNLAAVLTAALLLPLGTASIISFSGDIVLFCYLMGLGRFFAIIGAMDVGSSFEGMGASREATFSAIAEIGFFAVLGTLLLATGMTSFSSITTTLIRNTPEGIFFIGIISLALFLLMLIELSRIPVDDPNTHLELTMIHEVMLLDNAGVNLAIALYARYVKLVLLCAVIAALIVPPHLVVHVYVAAFTGVILAVGIAIGLVESFMARLRMTHVPQFIFLVTALAVLAGIMLTVFRGAQ
ncbi:MAG: NADH-quinone oxidoreductase subunit H [Spirochaetota bacterium]